MSHTPGPWKVVVFGTYARRKVMIKAHLDYLVANIPTFYPTGEHMDLEQRSNAALIAAAPDLLEALERAVNLYGAPGGPWNVPSDPGGWLEQAREAIAKAKGAA